MCQELIFLAAILNLRGAGKYPCPSVESSDVCSTQSHTVLTQRDRAPRCHRVNPEINASPAGFLPSPSHFPTLSRFLVSLLKVLIPASASAFEGNAK